MASLALRALALALTVLALLLYSSQMPRAVARSEKPFCDHCNVILISFDTVRADHLGVYGYGRDTSPNVDRFAEQALVFDEAISQAPWTLPAHGSMLSGLYPGRLGVLHYPASRKLPIDNPVLPEMFRAAGYATAGFTGGGFVSAHYGFDRGFDLYSTSGRHFEHNMDQALTWVRSNKDRPFFLFFHGYDAHRPYYSKPQDKTAMGLSESDASEQGRYCLRNDRARPDDARLDEIIRYYDAAIHHGDRSLGVFLRALNQLDLMENTVILLTSDHGEEFFEHGNCDHVRFVYRESVHVPYILYVPGYTRDTRHIPGLIPASISVARTLLDIVGVEHSMPGVTLTSLIEGKEREFPVVYSEADSEPGALGSRGACRAITRPNQKLISFTDEGSDEGYDLKKDLLERSVLPESSLVYTLRNTLRAFADAQKALPKPPDDAEDDQAILDDTSDGSGPGDAGDVGGDEPEEEPGAGKAALPGDGGPGGSGRGDGSGPDAGGVPGGKAGPGGKVGPGGGAKKPGNQKAPGNAAKKKHGSAVPDDVRESLRSLGYME